MEQRELSSKWIHKGPATINFWGIFTRLEKQQWKKREKGMLRHVIKTLGLIGFYRPGLCEFVLCPFVRAVSLRVFVDASNCVTHAYKIG